MESKYRVLRFIAGLYKVIAWVLLVAGVLGAVGTIVSGAVGANRIGDRIVGWTGLGGEGLLAGVAVGVGLLIAAVLLFVLLYAAGEVVTLALAIEQNTRESAYYMRGDAAAPPYNG